MITDCDFIKCRFECDCISLILTLIFGILICVSAFGVVHFFKWKIKKEQEFDKAIFENFRKRPSANGNVQNPGGTNGK